MIPEKIYNLYIIFPNRKKDELIAKLHELGTTEIKAPNINFEYSLENLSELHSTLSQISYDLTPIKPGEKLLSLDEITKNLKNYQEKLDRLKYLYKEKKDLISKKKELEDKINDAKLIFNYINYDKLPTIFKLKAFITKSPTGECFKLKDKYLCFSFDKHPEDAIFLTLPNSKKELDDWLAQHSNIENQIKIIDHEIQKIQEDEELRNLRYSIDIYLDREFVKSNIANFKNFSILEAYIPESFLDKTIQELKKMNVEVIVKESKDNVFFYKDSIFKDGQIVSYNYMGIPSRKDIDPGFLNWLIFPILFGFIVGDVGYGILIMILSKIIKFKDSIFQSMAKLWFIGGIWSVIFGVLYDEWMGFHILKSYKLGPLINRAHDVEFYIALSLAIGFVMLTLGYLIAIANYYRIKDFKHLKSSIGSILILLSIGAIFVYQQIAIIMFILGLLLLISSEGPIAILELTSFISNLLSFLRLSILGSVGVILASLINSTIGLPIIGIIIFSILHLLHTLLIILEGSIQAGRLQILEFGTKFFKGGGRFFKPFSIIKSR